MYLVQDLNIDGSNKLAMDETKNGDVSQADRTESIDMLFLVTVILQKITDVVSSSQGRFL